MDKEHGLLDLRSDLPMSETETQTPIPAEILNAVLALNDAQRLALGYQLIDSVEEAHAPPFPGWPADWEEELERRALAVERGEPTFSHEEVMARLEEGFREARSTRAKGTP